MTYSKYYAKKPGNEPNRPAKNGGHTAAETKMKDYMRIAGQAVLLLRKAVDEWNPEISVLNEVPSVIKENWMKNFISEAAAIVGDAAIPRGPHEIPEL